MREKCGGGKKNSLVIKKNGMFVEKKTVLFLIVGPKNLATWLISYQTQGPRRGERNVRGRTKKAQIARRRCRGQSCPRQTEITEGKSSMPPKATSQSVPRESTSAMSQP